MCHSRAECYLVLISFACIFMSVMVTVPMYILTYPGDECLLFISVRGEALIYGNPAGCHFLTYGHIVIIAGVLLLLFLLFCRNRKGFIKRPHQDVASTRTLRGTANALLPPPNTGSGPFNLGLVPSISMNTVQRKRFSRLYSLKVILTCGFLAFFTLVTAMVIVSGYIVSCNELHYETRRQLYGRTTLGTPIKHLSISCYSLFRDADFHSRFHFDHYEYSGQYHGQYRGYKHGRVHEYDTKHKHLISVAVALEMAIGGACISSVLWFILLAMLIYLRVVQKKKRNEEIAESMEDARIYTSSMDQMQMKPMDQMSVESQQSSVLSHKPTLISNDPSGTRPPSSLADQGYHTLQRQPLQQIPVSSQYQGQRVPIVQQQLQNQRLHFSQPNIGHPQQPQMQPSNANSNVQYVQLANGTLVPMTSIQLQQQQQQLEIQQQQMQQMLMQYQQQGPQQPSVPNAQVQPNLQRQQQAFMAPSPPPPTQQQSGAASSVYNLQPVQSSMAASQPQQQASPTGPVQRLSPPLPQQQIAPAGHSQHLQFSASYSQPQEQVSVTQSYPKQPSRSQDQPQALNIPSSVNAQDSPQAIPKDVSPIVTTRPKSPGLPRTSSRTITLRSKVTSTDSIEVDFDEPNNKFAQKKQLDASKDLGMKCSQI